MKIISNHDGGPTTSRQQASVTLQNDKSSNSIASPKVVNNHGEKSTKSYPSWHNIVAGAAAGAGARFFTAPLDLIKIRRQLMSPSSSGNGIASFSPLGLFTSLRDIVRNEGGLSSLFRGNLAATVSFLPILLYDMLIPFFPKDSPF